MQDRYSDVYYEGLDSFYKQYSEEDELNFKNKYDINTAPDKYRQFELGWREAQEFREGKNE